jgi:hypothetical protein
VIFDLRDEAAPTPIERRRWRYTVIICATLVIVLFAVAIGTVAWIRWRVHESAAADQVRGEPIMAAIVLPDSWQRAPVAYHPAKLFFYSQSWSQQIAADTTDVAAAQANLIAALQTAGWRNEEDCPTSSDPAAGVICYWQADGYRLESLAALEPGSSARPCPQGRASCVQVSLVLKPSRNPG